MAHKEYIGVLMVSLHVFGVFCFVYLVWSEYIDGYDFC